MALATPWIKALAGSQRGEPRRGRGRGWLLSDKDGRSGFREGNPGERLRTLFDHGFNEIGSFAAHVEVRAARPIHGSPERICRFLESLDHHLDLISERVDRLPSDQAGARVRLRGPLGFRRMFRIALTYADNRETVVARVEASRGTRATVRWSIQRSDVGSWVQVVGHADSLAPFDRLLVRLGARRWLT
ncbi:MAG: hypothetical protein ACRDQZ_10820, partial [Mycobacteriales bacterium]